MNPPSALHHLDEIRAPGKGKDLALFLDYDGTLTPIVSQPERADLSAEMRSVLARLASLVPVAVVSGRDRADVESRVALEQLYYAGSHGFEITGPGGLHQEHPGGVDALADLDEAEERLRRELEPIPGAGVERKRFSVAVHYRNVPDERAREVEAVVDRIVSGGLRKGRGKKVFDLQPDVDWNKGRAVLWLLEALGLDRPDVLPVYVGDDWTDEDAFRALDGRGVGIVVGALDRHTNARYSLQDPDEVREFLERLADRLELQRPASTRRRNPDRSETR